MDNLEQVKQLIRSRYEAEYCGFTERRSEGNSNDVFSDGMMCGESMVLYEIGCLLGMDGELEEPVESEYDEW